ncbi:MAG: hypothetical protein MJB14_05060 [Spirochaetes bacterium]|nr:hypothetical protein [Spirochaetota bacterium]
MMQEIWQAILSDKEFLLILVEILAGSAMAFFAILSFSKSRRISTILFVIAGVALYVQMVVRILEKLNIFVIGDFVLFDLKLIEFIIDVTPYLALIPAFFFLRKDN